MAEPQYNNNDTPMIEEQVETGLKALLESYRSNYNPSGERKNELYKRFTINPEQRLPEFDHEFAKAYKAIDDNNHMRDVYAMVCEKPYTYREAATAAAMGINIPGMVQLHGAGTVNCSMMNESRHVLFMERPGGVRLSDALKSTPRLHEHKIIDYIIQPIFQALMALREKKLSHGNIHAGSLYVGDTPTLGECYSAPSGTQSHYLYHPLERMLCSKMAFGEPNEKTDIYALGMLVYEVMFGLDKVKALPKDDYIRMVMTYGTYALLANNRTFSESFQDFFRGIFNDNPAERWGLDQLAQWISGKRFNMVVPILPKDGARPIMFLGENFVNRRLLAHSFYRNWREAVKEVKNMKLERWCENSLHRPELVEKIERALKIAGEASTEKFVNEMLMRIIGLLDPTSPIRSMSFVLRPDSIGILLADMHKQGNPPEASQLFDMIETDQGNFWAELSEANKYGSMPQVIWKLQRTQEYIKKKSLGFNTERVLYELNPAMACQSEMVASYYITSGQDLLQTLDALAPKLAANNTFLDKHIAAFLASKIEMTKEIRIRDIINLTKLERTEELLVLKIIAKAQQKYAIYPLVGLCTWAAMRVELMLDEVHNRILRKNLKMQLRKLAQNGKINDVIALILDGDVTRNDTRGFSHAIALHQINNRRIEHYQNPRLLEYHAREMGGKMAATMSYIILGVCIYSAFSSAFNI